MGPPGMEAVHLLLLTGDEVSPKSTLGIARGSKELGGRAMRKVSKLQDYENYEILSVLPPYCFICNA